MQVRNFETPDLLQVYSKPYDENMLRWRTLGARDKAADIEAMTHAIRSEISSVLDVGCGTGAVLGELADAGFGTHFSGVEITDERTATALRASDTRFDVRAYDGKTIPFPNDTFDFVYATHVLEHVTDPRGFLRELRRVSRRYVFLEIPCEDTIRATQRHLQPSLNIGHINAFTPLSFSLILETSGLVVQDMRLFDSSYAVHSFAANPVAAFVKMGLRRALLAASERLAAAVFTYHCAALCGKGALLNIV